jgi:predicted GNAT family N-acyltransferase
MLENFTVIDAFTEKHVNNLLELYRNETWTKDRTAADVKAMLNNCHFIALVNKNNDEIIAFARFLSDSVYRAFVYDVIVSMKYRGLGYGRIILDHLINSPLLKKVERVELCCLEHNVPFYEKFGFKKVPEPTNFMRRGIAKDLYF